MKIQKDKKVQVVTVIVQVLIVKVSLISMKVEWMEKVQCQEHVLKGMKVISLYGTTKS